MEGLDNTRFGITIGTTKLGFGPFQEVIYKNKGFTFEGFKRKTFGSEGLGSLKIIGSIVAREIKLLMISLVSVES